MKRVFVQRALMLGDLLATPALPWARELAARLGCVDDFLALPG